MEEAPEILQLYHPSSPNESKEPQKVGPFDISGYKIEAGLLRVLEDWIQREKRKQ